MLNLWHLIVPRFWLVHPGRLPWNLQITHLERKMIWTKPPWGHVPAVNLPGCKLLKYQWYFLIWVFPKIVESSILIGFSIIFTFHFGVPLIFGNTHILIWLDDIRGCWMTSLNLLGEKLKPSSGGFPHRSWSVKRMVKNKYPHGIGLTKTAKPIKKVYVNVTVHCILYTVYVRLIQTGQFQNSSPQTTPNARGNDTTKGINV